MPRITHSVHCRVSESAKSPTICGGSTLWHGNKVESVPPSRWPALVKGGGRKAKVRARVTVFGRKIKSFTRDITYKPCGRCRVGFAAMKGNGKENGKENVKSSSLKVSVKKAKQAAKKSVKRTAKVAKVAKKAASKPTKKKAVKKAVKVKKAEKVEKAEKAVKKPADKPARGKKGKFLRNRKVERVRRRLPSTPPLPPDIPATPDDLDLPRFDDVPPIDFESAAFESSSSLPEYVIPAEQGEGTE